MYRKKPTLKYLMRKKKKAKKSESDMSNTREVHRTMLIIFSVQRELFLLEVNNGETIAVIEENNDTYCLQKGIEKFPLNQLQLHSCKKARKKEWKKLKYGILKNQKMST